MSSKRETQEFYVRHMVCPRCVTSVRAIFEDAGYVVQRIELGYVAGVPPDDSSIPSAKLIEELHRVGFSLDRGGDGSISRLRGLIIDYTYKEVDQRPEKLSDHLVEQTGMSYSHISHVFSAGEGRTVEDFFRAHRLERAKRLLTTTDELISQIGYRLGYGTAAYFSADFRRSIGESPGAFRRRGNYRGMDLTKV
ncbi:helix-turn-helix domain-containing protein [Lewinella sp. 4G2]|uniref:helix-turn-helix domain-containing protein n=1 Tax=Lewinella sp. 4G2 TaxID=1803372 RepID=UPI0009ED7359|nr:helix-turn-helix domain-containing protein [Lewinella sp. 4G2]